MVQRFTSGDKLLVRQCMVFGCYADGRTAGRIDGEAVTFVRRLPRTQGRLIPLAEVVRPNGETVSVDPRYLTRPS